MFESIVEFLERFGVWGIFFHSFIDAIFFPIPAFFLQVTLSIANPNKALWIATVGYIACLLGTPIGYYIGKLVGDTILYRILKKKWIDAAIAMFQKSGESAILFGAFTPIPFKVFTIMSGALRFPLWKLMAYAALGRAVKFYVVGALFFMYGNAAEGMLKYVSFYIFILGVPAVLIYLLIKKKLKAKRVDKASEANMQSGLGVAEQAEACVASETDDVRVDADVQADGEVIEEREDEVGEDDGHVTVQIDVVEEIEASVDEADGHSADPK